MYYFFEILSYKKSFQHDTDDCPTQDNSHYVVKNENWSPDYDDDDETF